MWQAFEWLRSVVVLAAAAALCLYGGIALADGIALIGAILGSRRALQGQAGRERVQ